MFEKFITFESYVLYTIIFLVILIFLYFFLEFLHNKFEDKILKNKDILLKIEFRNFFDKFRAGSIIVLVALMLPIMAIFLSNDYYLDIIFYIYI